MLDLDKVTTIFLQFAGESDRRILHTGKIVSCMDGVLAAAFEEDGLPLEPGQDLLVYYEWQRKFVKQPARIDAILDASAIDVPETAGGILLQTADGPKPCCKAVTLSITGEPVSAESRQSFRVSTLISDRWAQLAGEKCKLMDVSATGYAVLSQKLYDVGKIIEGLVIVGDQQFIGQASVQNVRDMGRGRFRYGLYCADSRAAKNSLKDGLPQLSMAIQREQLKRRSGAA